MGEQFGHYRLEELIGAGGMGEVHRAFDTLRKRTVALKRLPAHMAADKDFQARFRREAELAARLTEPHIIPIHDYGEINGLLYIDMRLISGVDLFELIKRVGPLPPARAVSIIAQVASALAAAHAERLVHRDVKPSNVLVSESDRGEDFVHLLDFGVARNETATQLTATGSAVGTVDYMAPEQFGGGPIDHRVDVYALGCLLYECLTASKPFPTGGLPAKLQAHLTAPPPRPSQRRPDVPAGLDEVVARAMAKHPDQRFASTTELAISAEQAVRGAHSGPHSTGPHSTGPHPTGQSSGPRPVDTRSDQETRPVTTGLRPAVTPAHHRASPPPARANPQWSGPPPAAPQSRPPITPTRVEAPYRPAPPAPAPAAPARSAQRRGGGRGPVLAVTALVVVALAVAAYVFLVPSSTAGRTSTAATTSAPAAGGADTPTDNPGEPTAEPAPGAAAGASPDTSLYVDGYVAGELASARVTCTKLADSSWAWTAAGTIDGNPVEFTYNTNYYRGSADYNATTITDEQGGQMTSDAGGLAFVSNGSTRGVLSVAEDERSGSVDVTLEQGADTVQISGSWRCS